MTTPQNAAVTTSRTPFLSSFFGRPIENARPYVGPTRNLSHAGASSVNQDSVPFSNRRLESWRHGDSRTSESSSVPSQLRMGHLSSGNLSYASASTSNQDDEPNSNSNIRLWSDEVQQEISQAANQTPAPAPNPDQVMLDAILSGITRNQLNFKLLADVVNLLDLMAEGKSIDGYQTFSGIKMTKAKLSNLSAQKDLFKEMKELIEEKLNQLKESLAIPKASNNWHCNLGGKIPCLAFLDGANLCLSEDSLQQVQELLIPTSRTVLVQHPPRRTESGQVYDVYTMGERQREEKSS